MIRANHSRVKTFRRIHATLGGGKRQRNFTLREAMRTGRDAPAAVFSGV
jgi:hypothetical protein